MRGDAREKSSPLPSPGHKLKFGTCRCGAAVWYGDAGLGLPLQLVAVVVGLVRPVDRDTHIGGLLGSEVREPHAKLVQV
jgi:hypothetical protein